MFGVGEKGLHQIRPPVSFGFGNIGKSVPGQIHDIDSAIKEKIVHMNRLSRRIPHSGKILPVQKAINYGTLPDIGFSGKNYSLVAG